MGNLPGPINMPWEVCTQIGVTTQQPSIHFNNLVYAQINVSPESGPPEHPVTFNGSTYWISDWTVADAKPWGVPGISDPNGPAKFLMLHGEVGVTHGNTPETAGLGLYFRKLGDTTAINPPDFSYIGQTVAGLSGEGDRSNVTTGIYLVDGKFEWAYMITVPEVNWPTRSAFLVNLGPLVWYR